MARRVQGSQSRWVVGVDLGQRHDYSAVAVLEDLVVEFDERDPITYSFRRERRFRVRLVDRVRLGTPYTDVAAKLRGLVQSPELKGRCTLVMDATGVGAPVVDLVRASKPGCRIVPVMITGGDQEGSDGTVYRVPKRDLVLGLQVVLERRQLEIADRARAARELAEELAGMKAQPTGYGRHRYGADAAGHDDLTMAVSLAWWWIRRQEPRGCWGWDAAGGSHEILQPARLL